jgi:hypothetical protein
MLVEGVTPMWGGVGEQSMQCELLQSDEDRDRGSFARANPTGLDPTVVPPAATSDRVILSAHDQVTGLHNQGQRPVGQTTG